MIVCALVRAQRLDGNPLKEHCYKPPSPIARGLIILYARCQIDRLETRVLEEIGGRNEFLKPLVVPIPVHRVGFPYFPIDKLVVA